MNDRDHPAWAAGAAFALSLLLAWCNLLLTSRWAAVPGALHGWRLPWYSAALAATTIFALTRPAQLGRVVTIGRPGARLLAMAGGASLLVALCCRLPVTHWSEIPFKDDWTELFQQTVNGITLLRRGSVVGWNWWLLGGYPTSTDIAQNFAVLAFVPMTIFGNAIGYHVLHALLFVSLPLIIWWDLRQEDPQLGLVAAGFAGLFTAGYFATLGNSGDTNSLVGVCSTMVALLGSRGARLGRRWGGPVLLTGLVLGLYSHPAFFIYAVIFLALEALYFRDPRALVRLVIAAAFAGVAALPMHWETLRYHQYVSFNNTVFNPGAPVDWHRFARLVFYNVQILLLPGRWFNDYRSLANIWLPALILVAAAARRRRTGFYASAAVLTQVLLRFNTPEAGAVFDRIQHLLPVLEAPALAGLVLGFSGTRRLAWSLAALLGLFVATSYAPIRHVPDVRAFDPPLIDRIAASDGMVLVEVSPHRDMDADPDRRTPTTPFDVHFEGLLPGVAGQRFYSQMIDGWVWNIWRGQVVGAGTFNGRAIERTAPDAFASEMHRWGVRHLFVWTDASRNYLGSSRHFVERWRDGLWSEFECTDPDVRSVVTTSGRGALSHLTFLGGEVELVDVRAGEPVVVRANYYPAWHATADGLGVPLHPDHGQLGFSAPRSGTYVVHLQYPRYGWLSLVAAIGLVAGIVAVRRFDARERRT